MKKEVDYHEVTVTFVVSEREARRVTDDTNAKNIRTSLARMIKASLSDATTNVMDVEDVLVVIDGKIIQ